MRLWIAEKPTVAKDIANALGNMKRGNGFIECGNNDVVTWCVGHIIESADPAVYDAKYGEKWNKECLPLKLFPVKYQPKKNTEEQVKIVLDLLKKSSSVVNAGDPDDEGQLLVDEVLVYANYSNPVKRVLINDNSDQAVKKAVSRLRDNKEKEFQGMYNKALARSVSDAIFGLSMTRAYTVDAQAQGYKGVLSVGRVQTPILGLICKRYLDNKNHKEASFQTINATFERNGEVFNSNWKVNENSPQDEKKRLNSEEHAKKLVSFFKGKKATIISAGVEDKITNPPLPFNLSDLQQLLINKHKISADNTLKLTQDLREKFKCITYNRSDCSYLSDEQYSEAPHLLNVLKKIVGDDLGVDEKIKSKAFNNDNVTAHTAIIPTQNIPDMGKLTDNEKIVYLAIVERYLIQFMPPKRYQEASAILKIDLETFSCRSINLTDAGFTSFYNDTDNDNIEDHDNLSELDNSQFSILSKLRTGDEVICSDASYKNNKTKAPPLFTESSLLNAMDNIVNYVVDPHIKSLLKLKDAGKKKGQKGIGTQATRASFVPLLIKRGFITIEKQKLIPTQAGLDFYQSLPDVITQPDLTALWSEKLTEIEQGTFNIDVFISDLYVELENHIKNMEMLALKVSNKSSQNVVSFSCPQCGNAVIDKDKLVVCEKNCGFRFFLTICQKKLTIKQIETLFNKGITPTIKGFTGKNGKPFDAQLTLEDKISGKIGFKFAPRDK